MYGRIDPKTYASQWAHESTHIESQGTYQWLSSVTPSGNVLEIGSGIGFGTISLAATRAVLSLDSNVDLIEKARMRVQSCGVNAEILCTDFLRPSTEAIARIQSFVPKVVVAWFVGSNADDQEKHASEVPWLERAKKYRENVEDAVLALPLCQPSVEWVHLATRTGRVSGFTDEQVKLSQLENYDQYVFHPNGFEVTDIQIMPWDRQDSQFGYQDSFNPNRAPGPSEPAILSILAKRRVG
ncbi:class I SAM-dependent methyltransferase [Pseudomonas sp. MAFF 302046]|uniref:Class I SAM-dependent methyltransferase n=1 Tax=Pseudomonas morbosilactucae TaxID=2938197 RepID=A0ABT0JF99_9PSED|nr:class I SAM-dependent methyltransferase [Pseudomonas morbosilactucae]MCK9814593.1 class I SAM-dependent methyltransferase [Pseudomonas morbosilactucae]